MPIETKAHDGFDAEIVPDLQRATSAQSDDLNAEIIEAKGIIDAENSYEPRLMKRLSWKIDLIMMPMLMFTYGLQYSDKLSLSSGVVFGLKKDAHLVGNQYAQLTIYFYIAFLVGQIPMQWLLQRIPLGKGLSVTVILWGICVLCLGFCQNYAQLAVVRTLLGWFECAITPGFLLVVASWYKRSESTLRASLFFAMNTFFSIVFGVIIYFLGKNSEENGGPAGWRVINYFLGGITILDGVIMLFFFGLPHEVWWLTKEEKMMAKARIIGNATGGGESHPWKWEQVRECFVDPQYYFTILFNLMATIPTGALGTFSVLVYSSFGFSNTESVLYGIPSSAIGFVAIIATGWVVNRHQFLRFPAAILWNVVPMIVFLYVGLAQTGKWQKWACFIFVSVFALTQFMMWSLLPLNVAGRTKKSWLSGTAFACYCVGNIIGSQIFLPSDAPKYLHGLTACAIVMAVNNINLVAWWVYYKRTNKNREAAFVASGISQEERAYLNKLAGETDVTDLNNPHFRYTC